MKHPTKEELVSLLYGEVSPEKRTELNAHLRTCGECQSQMASWKSVQSELQSWQVPTRAKTTSHLSKAVPWAAAAVLMIGISFGFGRFTAPQPNLEEIRAAIEPQLRETFSQELKTARETDRKQFIAMLRDIEEQRLADYTTLRKDLETVAILADEKLTQTQRVLSQANLFAQSDNNKTQPQ